MVTEEQRLKHNEYMREYKKRPHVRAYYRKYNAAWRKQERNRKKYLAHEAIGNAVYYGKIIRPTECEHCHISCKTVAHHPDHDKKLEVLWLCPLCHSKEHRRVAEELQSKENTNNRTPN